jgi:cytidine deaminase
MGREIDQPTWGRLATAAWKVRDNAYLAGATKVGAAVLCPNGQVYAGCNVEHRFRSHDIHAEVNAIGSMVAAGERRFLAILVVADREHFTPCGGCMDWIMELGGPEAIVGVQRDTTEPARSWSAIQLMPYYPKADYSGPHAHRQDP